MSTVTTLLDTPKKLSLQSQSITLRASLKDFERCFSEQHGRKPKQTDIKNDVDIATKYREYQRVQDVLSGKIAYEKLNDVKPKHHGRSKSRTDSGIGSSPRKQDLSTPRKSVKLKTLEREDSQEEDDGEVLQPILLNAIGPTPHRDGKVLGLFDLLAPSGSVTTPSTARKRKMDELFENTPAKRSPLAAIQTPGGRSRRADKREGDLLDFLSGTPVKEQQVSAVSGARYSRTPQSAGKKFQLSQLFATPETARILFQAPGKTQSDVQAATAERTTNPNETPRKQPDATGLDATPTYLRRSTSFKDRLLSASMGPGASLANDSRRSSSMQGPPTLRSFRSSTSNVLKDIDLDTVPSKTRRPQQYAEDEEENYDDELEALRELEAEEAPQRFNPRILVEDSQFDIDGDIEIPTTTVDGEVRKPYKKKGQKRTTKRVNIKPITQAIKSIAEPRFVVADGTFSDEEEMESVTEALQSRKTKKGKKDGKQTDARMINPNAQSHTNYRSLKIRSRNTKAAGAGKRRFGGRK